MLNHPTLEQLRSLKLTGMAQAFSEQLELGTNGSNDLSFEERLAILVEREAVTRDNKRLTTRLRNAKLRHQASIEDIDYKHPRNLDKKMIKSLATCAWLQDKHNLIITGATGTGKTYLGCALAQQACRLGFTALYKQTSRLLQELVVSKGDGRYLRLLNKLTKTHILILDDWGLDAPNAEQRRVLFELLDERYERSSTLIVSQLPVNLWYDNLDDPTLADAILDRVIHNAYRLELKGESLRKTKLSLTKDLPSKS